MKVNENGAFSFQEPWKFSHPNRFPTNYFATRMRHVLAPFWTDNDIRREGTIRYVAIERGISYPGDIIINETAVYVNDYIIINETTSGEDEKLFEPKWMLVAQWDGVHPYPHGSDSREGFSEEYLNRVSLYLHSCIINQCVILCVYHCTV